MTVGSACKTAALRLVGNVPSTIFSTDEQLEQELADLANETAVDIMRSHDWRVLTRISTLTGDGSRTSFPLPTDYDRMVQGQSVHDSATGFWGYTNVPDLDEWITITTTGFLSVTPGWWTLLGGQIQFSPAPPVGQQASYAYISKNVAQASGGALKATFTQDDDAFRLDERLLTLGIIWRWRAQKRLDYSEDMASYEKAFSEQATRDKGARVIRRGEPRVGLGRLAWPWRLGPV